ncbi:sensor domain-containing diguanylate cyclase [Pseudacidovorax intermedius]|uniref:Diguanylate cyclase n=1 Tax=Pseudacidovorax intermedius TaxID=433924 RepID=A0A147H2D5_9BURK|nr:sensor domain-containing diguanylate cyclase [Pseudacidovorax intermedius]KTT24088.1 diguanylate cyclase [Pseudacidovorax intermedius]
MIPAPVPADDARRVRALHALGVLDTAPEERFDRVTRLARRMFQVPIALVSLVDAERQWFKSRQGVDAQELPRDVSFCGHAILQDVVMEVPDLADDQRFHDNPLVAGAPHVRFYAGAPLTDAQGHRLGTLCILDHQPRRLSTEDRALLGDLADMVREELLATQAATTDHLTQLSNRRGFEALGEHVLAVCRRLNMPARLLYLDLDGFKQINDQLGHAEGDAALVRFADALRGTFRAADVCARLGGDEFAVLMSHADDRAVKAGLGRLEETIRRGNAQTPPAVALRYSTGWARWSPQDGGDMHALLRDADRAMYRHKRQRGREDVRAH